MYVWFTIPPLVSLPIALALAAFGSDAHRIHAGAPLWLLMIVLYTALTMMYAFSIKNGLSSHLLPLQMASQGIIICIISLEAGAPPITPWAGVAIAVSGFALIVHLFFGQRRERKSGGAHDEARIAPAAGALDTLDSSPFPQAAADDGGVIFMANDPFKEIVGVEEPEGKIVTDFFTPGEDEVTIKGNRQSVFQKANGELFYFLLVDPPKSTAPPAPPQRPDPDLMDADTGLYSKKYSTRRVPEELGRAGRYRRWLCGILLKVTFTSLPGLGRRQDLEEAFFTAYAQYVKAEIRDSDMGFYLGDREILLLLPETPQQGAKETSLRLVDLPEELLELKGDLPFSVDIQYGFMYYSGNYPLTYEQFMQKLYSSLGGVSE